ncbi:hypothetical protein VTJ83DRAFT_6761 [Remersonia thermophila]|uniref:Uncharacterized protein n=1 Tax=Remersonia thermophila TaxID=72144 RepID=A0ABR4D5M3_9PEZI
MLGHSRQTSETHANLDISSLLGDTDSNESRVSPAKREALSAASESASVTSPHPFPQAAFAAPASSGIPSSPHPRGAEELKPETESGAAAQLSPTKSSRPPSSSGSSSSKHTMATKPPLVAAKRQSKWSAQEDRLIIELRQSGMKWDDISKHLPGRSAISCRLHYQNYLERRGDWDEERKNKLARLYERFKPEMWAKVAEELHVPWRAAEAMHWQLGEIEIARRAGVTPFSLTTTSHEPSTTHRRTESSPTHHADGHRRSHSASTSFARDFPGGLPSPRYTRGPPPLPPPQTASAPYHYHQLSQFTTSTASAPSSSSSSYPPLRRDSFAQPRTTPTNFGPPLQPEYSYSAAPAGPSNSPGGGGSTGRLLPSVAEITTGSYQHHHHHHHHHPPYTNSPAHQPYANTLGSDGSGSVWEGNPRGGAREPAQAYQLGPFRTPTTSRSGLPPPSLPSIQAATAAAGSGFGLPSLPPPSSSSSSSSASLSLSSSPRGMPGTTTHALPPPPPPPHPPPPPGPTTTSSGGQYPEWLLHGQEEGQHQGQRQYQYPPQQQPPRHAQQQPYEAWPRSPAKRRASPPEEGREASRRRGLSDHGPRRSEVNER